MVSPGGPSDREGECMDSVVKGQESAELERLYREWTDEALVRALTDHRAQYREEVLPIMERELQARNLPVPPSPPPLPEGGGARKRKRIAAPPAVGAAIGAGIGALVGLAIPVVVTCVFLKQGGDPVASGGVSFIAIGTIPIGLALGAAIGALRCAMLRRRNANITEESACHPSDGLPGPSR